MPKVTLVCPVCEQTFLVYPAAVRQGRTYCGQVCANTGTSRMRTVACEQCGQPFTASLSEIEQGRRFCSKRCRAFWQTGERHNRYKGGPQEFACENCGKPTMRQPSQVDSHNYCSRECKHAHERGPNSPNWKGGRTKSGDYIKVYAPDHPNAGKDGYVGEHVLVASQKIGRPLQPGEHAHHDDEDTFNNDPANLIVLTASEHKKLHHARAKEKKALG